MNKIMTIPELKAEPLVYGFIRCSEPMDWMKLKKDYTFEEKLKIDKIKTLKGKIRLAIDPKIAKVVNFTRQNLVFS